MGKTNPQTIVLDTGALMAFERGDPKMRALAREALKAGARLVIPAGVLGQAWRGAARQAPLRALVKMPTAIVPALDEILAERRASSVAVPELPTSSTLQSSSSPEENAPSS